MSGLQKKAGRTVPGETVAPSRTAGVPQASIHADIEKEGVPIEAYLRQGRETPATLRDHYSDMGRVLTLTAKPNARPEKLDRHITTRLPLQPTANVLGVKLP